MSQMNNNKTLFPPTVAALALALAACGTDTVNDGPTGSSPVRLVWFQTTASGDPAQAPNPHAVQLAVAPDGVNFEDAVTIFEADDLVDPDFFPLLDGSGFGLLYTDFASNQVKYAFSTTVDGTYSAVGSAVTTGGQSATIESNGELIALVSGISSFPLTATATGAQITSGGSVTNGLITAATLGKSSGVTADPTVIELSDGSYRAYIKYAASGAQPNAHEVWTLTSSDLQNWGNPLLIRESASVPGAVRVGNEIFLYFVDFSGDLSPTASLAYGLSTNGGTEFEYGTVMLDGEAITGAYDPAALPVE
jgi:hypothetical protein